MVSHSSRENRRSQFFPFPFLISSETCRRSSFLSDCSPISNLEVRYCLTFSEKRTAPPFGLWSTHPSLKFDWKGSLPCLLITLVLSSSERVRGENFSTQLKTRDSKAVLMSKINENDPWMPVLSGKIITPSSSDAMALVAVYSGETVSWLWKSQFFLFCFDFVTWFCHSLHRHASLLRNVLTGNQTICIY